MHATAGAPGSRKGPAASGPAIVAALASERRALERGAGRAAPGWTRVLQSGPGPVAARTAAARAVDAGACALVSWGIAGGLIPDAQPGTVILPPRVIAGEGDVVATDADWRSRVNALLPPEIRRLERDLASVPHVLVRPADKSRLAAALSVAAADLESHAVGREAVLSGIPFIAIRVIVDGPDDLLPDDVEALVRPNGEVARLRALTSALRNPARLRLFTHLGRRSALAHQVLTATARALGAEQFGFGQRVDRAGPVMS